ncbi:hypothetical protein COBT_000825 [Conglomerata obtusa]
MKDYIMNTKETNKKVDEIRYIYQYTNKNAEETVSKYNLFNKKVDGSGTLSEYTNKHDKETSSKSNFNNKRVDELSTESRHNNEYEQNMLKNTYEGSKKHNVKLLAKHRYYNKSEVKLYIKGMLINSINKNTTEFCDNLSKEKHQDDFNKLICNCSINNFASNKKTCNCCNFVDNDKNEFYNENNGNLIKNDLMNSSNLFKNDLINGANLKKTFKLINEFNITNETNPTGNETMKTSNYIKKIIDKYFNTTEQQHIHNIINYNIKGGKKTRSKLFSSVLKKLVNKQSPIIEFLIEVLQGSFCIVDDIMDNSECRRGSVCWYRKIGMVAIKDAMLIVNLIYKILGDLDLEITLPLESNDKLKDKNNTNVKNEFYDTKIRTVEMNDKIKEAQISNKKYWKKTFYEIKNINTFGDFNAKDLKFLKSDSCQNYNDDSMQEKQNNVKAIINKNKSEIKNDHVNNIEKCKNDYKNYRIEIQNIFLNIILKTCLGQTQDSQKIDTSNQENIIKNVTLNNYKQLCYSKNGPYTFYMPIKLAYICARKKEPKNLMYICENLGLLHQMRDDFLNFFPEISGKSDNDLEERKLTFFICKLVDEGENLKNYFNGGDVGIVREKIQRLLDGFDNEENKVIDIIKGYSNVENQEIVDMCLSLFLRIGK